MDSLSKQGTITQKVLEKNNLRVHRPLYSLLQFPAKWLNFQSGASSPICRSLSALHVALAAPSYHTICHTIWSNISQQGDLLLRFAELPADIVIRKPRHWAVHATKHSGQPCSATQRMTNKEACKRGETHRCESTMSPRTTSAILYYGHLWTRHIFSRPRLTPIFTIIFNPYVFLLNSYFFFLPQFTLNPLVSYPLTIVKVSSRSPCFWTCDGMHVSALRPVWD
jgi:hypothetical protein